jgi:hypothetical protein
VPDFAHKICA